MRHIQKKSLPLDWLKQVEEFDIQKSLMSENTKLLALKLIQYIKSEKEKSLTSYFVQPLIKHIIFGEQFAIPYDDIPRELVEEVLQEINGQRGLSFTQKCHSVFIELQTYQKLVEDGFVIDDFNRLEGSCDLVMRKEDQIYNFEVKFKESKDVMTSRFFDYIDGMSFLEENSFLRDKIFELYIKVDDPNYKTQKEILKEIDQFIEKKNDIFVGDYVDIFPAKERKKVSRDIKYVSDYLGSLHISEEFTDPSSIEDLIKEIFIDNNGHIAKLSKKSKELDNFKGCLVWSIPFHKDINIKHVEEAFKKLDLDFDLYVFLSGIRQDPCNFIVEGKSS